MTRMNSVRRISWFLPMCIAVMLMLLMLPTLTTTVRAQTKDVWAKRLLATNEALQSHFWNSTTGNFVRRADNPHAAGSDSWGITIVLDAYAYMVDEGLMKPEALRQYYDASTRLYERTGGTSGARILAQQGTEVYIGGDDDMQWAAALLHDYEVTNDSEYLNAAASAFAALIDQGFWIQHGTGGASGWAWNSGDRRPNGVSTAYGALAAARLYAATKSYVYRNWAIASLAALRTPQVGFFPRDRMVAAQAALQLYQTTNEKKFLSFAEEMARTASADAKKILAGTMTGTINPTDLGDLAEGYARLAHITGSKEDDALAKQYLALFLTDRTDADIAANGFYSLYTSTGKPVMTGNYIGVPRSVLFLPENAEMLKLCAVAYKYF